MPASLPYDFDAAVAALRAADPTLSTLIDRVPDARLTLREADSPFAYLLRAIVYQQLSGKAAATIHGRVVALFPEQVATPEDVADIADEDLRGAGLSRQKLSYVRSLAAHAREGHVPDRATLETWTDDAIIAHLTQVKGIGRWTVEMLLLFYLGRPDVLPVHDLGIRKGYAAAYGLDDLPAPKALTRYGERWRPYRSVASWYLWRATEL